jgi:hypothetical protein
VKIGEEKELNPEGADRKPKTRRPKTENKEPEPLLVPAPCVGWLPG